MGLETKNANVVFLSLISGKLVRRVQEPTESSESRTLTKGPNSGSVIHEEKYDSLTGIIKSVTVEDKDVPWQKEKIPTVVLIMEDEGDVYKIEWDLSSSYSKSFINRMEGINYGEEVEFNTFWIKGDDDKHRGFVGLKQGGNKIEKLYTDEQVPKIKPVKVGDKTHYDDSDLLKFMRAIVDNVSGQLKSSEPEQAEQPKEETQNVESDAPKTETGGKIF